MSGILINPYAIFTDVIAPTITSASSVSVAENATLSFTITTDEPATITIGGADAAQVELASNTLATSHTLRWSSNGTRDYETPADSDADNVYDITITATDAALNASTPQSFAITVTNVAYATFDGTLTNVTLSGGDLTAAHTNTSLAGARSTALKNSGKWYLEFTLTTRTGANSAVGVLTAAGTYTNFSANINCAVIYGSGNIYSNNAFSSRTLGALSNGDIIGVAVDLDNDKVWFRKAPAGNWNGQVIGSQDPAGNVGGVSISSFTATTMAPAITFGGTGTGATETFTMNAGATSFSGTVPSGFSSGWLP